MSAGELLFSMVVLSLIASDFRSPNNNAPIIQSPSLVMEINDICMACKYLMVRMKAEVTSREGQSLQKDTHLCKYNATMLEASPRYATPPRGVEFGPHSGGASAILQAGFRISSTISYNRILTQRSLLHWMRSWETKTDG